MPLKPNIIVDVDGVILEWTKLGNISEEEKYEKLCIVNQLPNVFEAVNKLRENYRINFCTARNFEDAYDLTYYQLLAEPKCLIYQEDVLLVGVPSEYKHYLIQPLQAKIIIDDHPNVIHSVNGVMCLPVFIRRGRRSFGFTYEAEDLLDAVNKIETIWQGPLSWLRVWDSEIKADKKYFDRVTKQRLLKVSKPEQLELLF